MALQMIPGNKSYPLLFAAGLSVVFILVLMSGRATLAQRSETDLKHLLTIALIQTNKAEGIGPAGLKAGLMELMKDSGFARIQVRDQTGQILADTGQPAEAFSGPGFTLRTADQKTLTVSFLYSSSRDPAAAGFAVKVGAVLLVWAMILYGWSMGISRSADLRLRSLIRRMEDTTVHGATASEGHETGEPLWARLDRTVMLLVQANDQLKQDRALFRRKARAHLGALKPALRDLAESLREVGRGGSISQKESVEDSGRGQGPYKIAEALALCDEDADILHQGWESMASFSELTHRLDQDIRTSHGDVEGILELARNTTGMAGEARMGVEDAHVAIASLSKLLKELETRAAESAEMSAQTTERISREGMLSVVSSVEGIERIEEGVTSVTETIERLGERSRDIQKILSVIREVTEQTRLLSLNAHILAVQAGESGKGFTVVADEMQDLSDKTAQSAKGIADIVGTIIREIQEASRRTAQVVPAVAAGTELVMKIGAVLREILISSQTSTQFAQSVRGEMAAQSGDLTKVLDSVDVFRNVVANISTGATTQAADLGKILMNLGSLKQYGEHLTRAVEDRALDTRRLLNNKDRIKELLTVTEDDSSREPGKSIPTDMLQTFDYLGEITARLRKEVDILETELGEE